MQPYRRATEDGGEHGDAFHTPDTQQIANRLNHRYDDKPAGLQTHRGDAAVYQDSGTYPTLSAVANQLGLLPGNAKGNRRWLWFLDYIDPLPGPSGLSTIGAELRDAMVVACNDPNCTAIEFFSVPDTNVSLHLGNMGNGDGTYSRIVTLYTTLIDQLGAPQ